MTNTNTSTIAESSRIISVNHAVSRIFAERLIFGILYSSRSTQPVPQTVWISFWEKPVSIFLRRYPT